MITFTVYGKQIPQGSKRTVPIYRDGKPVMIGDRTLTRVAPDNPGLPGWRQEIAHVARRAYDGESLDGPISLTVCIVRPRPKGHFGSGRNAGKLKESAPHFPTTRPDSLKLVRAVEDAITGVLYLDDAQIVRHTINKEFGREYSLTVTVSEITDAGGTTAAVRSVEDVQRVLDSEE